jgi:hypothetical protein
MVERRKRERRNWRSKSRYPLFDAAGILVIGNRRRIVDRRASGKSTFGKPAGNERLRLYFHAGVIELSSGTSRTVVLGRAAACDIEVTQCHVSRQHARIEGPESAFALIDTSTNGTYIKFDNGREMHLVNDRLALEGSGIISLGKPITERAPDLIYFLCA